jgi:hypothetical protein
MYVLESDRRHAPLVGGSGGSGQADYRRPSCGRTLCHMATPFLIVLVEVAVIAAILYLAVRFGVRDGMTNYENRKMRRGP